MRLEFLQARHDNLGQVALLVTVGDLDRFIQLAFAQRAGHGRSKARDCFLAALYAMKRSIMTPIDHADMMNSRTTTPLAKPPICAQRWTGSQPTLLSSCSIDERPYL